MLRRYSVFFVLLLVGCGFISTAQSGENREQPNWRLSIDVDYLAKGNADSTLPSSSNICANLLRQNGGVGGPCSTTARSYGAEGLRIKAMRERTGIEVGPSIGYLNGGPGVGTINVRATTAPRQATVTSSANTMRFLGEARNTWSLSKSVRARMGTGLGIAVENTTLSNSGFGTDSYISGYSDYSSLGWFTWELSPALVYKDISLGVRYVGFARGGQVPWNTCGAFFGVDF